jgi:hypothetical protein
MSSDTSIDISSGGWIKWLNVDAGTTPLSQPPKVIDLLMAAPVLPKPALKNRSVEKKIKQKGWSKQFYEK